MTKLNHLFKINQRVVYIADDFDGSTKWNGIVTQIESDHMIITTDDGMKLWIEEDVNLDCVYPAYNF